MKFHPTVEAIQVKILAGKALAPLEIVDAVIAHAKHQNRFAVNEGNGSCRYRGSDLQGETACLVGCLIPDLAYDPKSEGGGISGVLLNDRLSTSLETHSRLLRELQAAHDGRSVAPDSSEVASRVAHMLEALGETRKRLVREAASA